MAMHQLNLLVLLNGQGALGLVFFFFTGFQIGQIWRRGACLEDLLGLSKQQNTLNKGDIAKMIGTTWYHRMSLQNSYLKVQIK